MDLAEGTRAEIKLEWYANALARQIVEAQNSRFRKVEQADVEAARTFLKTFLADMLMVMR